MGEATEQQKQVGDAGDDAAPDANARNLTGEVGVVDRIPHHASLADLAGRRDLDAQHVGDLLLDWMFANDRRGQPE